MKFIILGHSLNPCMIIHKIAKSLLKLQYVCKAKHLTKVDRWEKRDKKLFICKLVTHIQF